MKALVTFGAFVTAVSACQAQTPSTAPAPGDAALPSGKSGQASLWFEPGDMVSAASGAIRVGLHGSTGFAKPALEALRGCVSLQTWPERDSVPSAITVEEASTKPDNAQEYFIKVLPNAELQPRWYAIVIARPSIALFVPPSLPAVRLPDGALAARFRRDSFPSISQLSFCRKSDGVSLRVSLSERVVLTGKGRLVIDGANSDSCRLETSAGARVSSLFISCAGSFAHPKSVTVDGEVLGLAAQVPTVLTASSDSGWEPGEAGCDVFRP